MRHRGLIGITLAALIMGALIAWVDSRPTWDDTGITVGILLLVCAGFGMLRPRYAWLWALAVGAWIPLLGIVRTHSASLLPVLAIAFAGAYAGALTRRLLMPGSQTESH
jgi:hypothetical protein